MKFKLSDPGGSSSYSEVHPRPNTATTTNKKIIFFSLLAVFLILASAVSAVVILSVRTRASRNDQNAPTLRGKPTEAISRTCSKTQFPTLCINYLLNFPGSKTASEKDLIHISFNMTLQHLNKALYSSTLLSSSVSSVNPRVTAAYDDCLELLDDSIDAVARSLSTVATPSSVSGTVRSLGSSDDVMTWLSAALTNQDTCAEGFADTSGDIKEQMSNNLRDISELVSNCLAIFSSVGAGEDFSGVPIQNKRRLMTMREDKFPIWLKTRDRRLLGLPVSQIQADIIVSKDGNGTVKKISEAIKKAPEYSSRRFIIYIRAGRYEEQNLKVGRKKTNLIFIGDGKGKTVITGGKNFLNGTTTFRTASFAASGAGFIARDITFENYAGPEKHQAVALRVGSDHSVIYRCSIIGYQDTCYAHSNRQFYRECDIYGTVDFVFGNAAVVFQNCSLNARKPMAQQKNTITAQNRKDPNQNTGISIHDCQIRPTPDLEAVKGSYQTYLGRPWKLYSRTVYMMSYMGDHVHQRGWLEWNTTFALDTLYYGEYMNYGPGAAIGQRVKWPGYRVITSTVEASRFTVGQFISGSTWLPSTGVSYLAGLST
ncbi:hypothetical protein Lal_00002253 [Lupinus albus]|uniref:Pectinesterase n=1 Tax=Lupinus albus TaxID=3870 RepID=A0A6A5P826_LUPAL|nr:putative pectinesterase [Lupinus albus]KAF1893734.1 hypothetical protein Lal_00002253 [Lupinus albus]